MKKSKQDKEEERLERKELKKAEASINDLIRRAKERDAFIEEPKNIENGTRENKDEHRL